MDRRVRSLANQPQNSRTRTKQSEKKLYSQDSYNRLCAQHRLREFDIVLHRLPTDTTKWEDYEASLKLKLIQSLGGNSKVKEQPSVHCINEPVRKINSHIKTKAVSDCTFSKTEASSSHCISHEDTSQIHSTDKPADSEPAFSFKTSDLKVGSAKLGDSKVKEQPPLHCNIGPSQKISSQRKTRAVSNSTLSKTEASSLNYLSHEVTSQIDSSDSEHAIPLKPASVLVVGSEKLCDWKVKEQLPLHCNSEPSQKISSQRKTRAVSNSTLSKTEASSINYLSDEDKSQIDSSHKPSDTVHAISFKPSSVLIVESAKLGNSKVKEQPSPQCSNKSSQKISSQRKTRAVPNSTLSKTEASSSHCLSHGDTSQIDSSDRPASSNLSSSLETLSVTKVSDEKFTSPVGQSKILENKNIEDNNYLPFRTTRNAFKKLICTEKMDSLKQSMSSPNKEINPFLVSSSTGTIENLNPLPTKDKKPLKRIDKVLLPSPDLNNKKALNENISLTSAISPDHAEKQTDFFAVHPDNNEAFKKDSGRAKKRKKNSDVIDTFDTPQSKKSVNDAQLFSPDGLTATNNSTSESAKDSTSKKRAHHLSEKFGEEVRTSNIFKSSAELIKEVTKAIVTSNSDVKSYQKLPQQNHKSDYSIPSEEINFESSSEVLQNDSLNQVQKTVSENPSELHEEDIDVPPIRKQRKISSTKGRNGSAVVSKPLSNSDSGKYDSANLKSNSTSRKRCLPVCEENEEVKQVSANLKIERKLSTGTSSNLNKSLSQTENQDSTSVAESEVTESGVASCNNKRHAERAKQKVMSKRRTLRSSVHLRKNKNRSNGRKLAVVDKSTAKFSNTLSAHVKRSEPFHNKTESSPKRFLPSQENVNIKYSDPTQKEDKFFRKRSSRILQNQQEHSDRPRTEEKLGKFSTLKPDKYISPVQIKNKSASCKDNEEILPASKAELNHSEGKKTATDESLPATDDSQTQVTVSAYCENSNKSTANTSIEQRTAEFEYLVTREIVNKSRSCESKRDSLQKSRNCKIVPRNKSVKKKSGVSSKSSLKKDVILSKSEDSCESGVNYSFDKKTSLRSSRSLLGADLTDFRENESVAKISSPESMDHQALLSSTKLLPSDVHAFGEITGRNDLFAGNSTGTVIPSPKNIKPRISANKDLEKLSNSPLFSKNKDTNEEKTWKVADNKENSQSLSLNNIPISKLDVGEDSKNESARKKDFKEPINEEPRLKKEGFKERSNKDKTAKRGDFKKSSNKNKNEKKEGLKEKVNEDRSGKKEVSKEPNIEELAANGDLKESVNKRKTATKKNFKESVYKRRRTRKRDSKVKKNATARKDTKEPSKKGETAQNEDFKVTDIKDERETSDLKEPINIDKKTTMVDFKEPTNKNKKAKKADLKEMIQEDRKVNMEGFKETVNDGVLGRKEASKRTSNKDENIGKAHFKETINESKAAKKEVFKETITKDEFAKGEDFIDASAIVIKGNSKENSNKDGNVGKGNFKNTINKGEASTNEGFKETISKDEFVGKKNIKETSHKDVVSKKGFKEASDKKVAARKDGFKEVINKIESEKKGDFKVPSDKDVVIKADFQETINKDAKKGDFEETSDKDVAAVKEGIHETLNRNESSEVGDFKEASNKGFADIKEGIQETLNRNESAEEGDFKEASSKGVADIMEGFQETLNRNESPEEGDFKEASNKGVAAVKKGTQETLNRNESAEEGDFKEASSKGVADIKEGFQETLNKDVTVKKGNFKDRSDKDVEAIKAGLNKTINNGEPAKQEDFKATYNKDLEARSEDFKRTGNQDVKARKVSFKVEINKDESVKKEDFKETSDKDVPAKKGSFKETVSNDRTVQHKSSKDTSKKDVSARKKQFTESNKDNGLRKDESFKDSYNKDVAAEREGFKNPTHKDESLKKEDFKGTSEKAVAARKGSFKETTNNDVTVRKESSMESSNKDFTAKKEEFAESNKNVTFRKEGTDRSKTKADVEGFKETMHKNEAAKKEDFKEKSGKDTSSGSRSFKETTNNNVLVSKDGSKETSNEVIARKEVFTESINKDVALKKEDFKEAIDKNESVKKEGFKETITIETLARKESFKDTINKNATLSKECFNDTVNEDIASNKEVFEKTITENPPTGKEDFGIAVKKDVVARQEVVKETITKVTTAGKEGKAVKKDVAARKEVVKETITKDTTAEKEGLGKAVKKDVVARQEVVKETITKVTTAGKEGLGKTINNDVGAGEEVFKEIITKDPPAEKEGLGKAVKKDVVARQEVVKEIITKDTTAGKEGKAVKKDVTARKEGVKETITKHTTAGKEGKAVKKDVTGRKEVVKEIIPRDITAGKEGFGKTINNDVATGEEVFKEIITKDPPAEKEGLGKAVKKDVVARQDVAKEKNTKVTTAGKEGFGKTINNDVAAGKEVVKETISKDAVARKEGFGKADKKDLARKEVFAGAITKDAGVRKESFKETHNKDVIAVMEGPHTTYVADLSNSKKAPSLNLNKYELRNGGGSNSTPLIRKENSASNCFNVSATVLNAMSSDKFSMLPSHKANMARYMLEQLMSDHPAKNYDKYNVDVIVSPTLESNKLVRAKSVPKFFVTVGTPEDNPQDVAATSNAQPDDYQFKVPTKTAPKAKKKPPFCNTSNTFLKPKSINVDAELHRILTALNKDPKFSKKPQTYKRKIAIAVVNRYLRKHNPRRVRSARMQLSGSLVKTFAKNGTYLKEPQKILMNEKGAQQLNPIDCNVPIGVPGGSSHVSKPQTLSRPCPEHTKQSLISASNITLAKIQSNNAIQSSTLNTELNCKVHTAPNVNVTASNRKMSALHVSNVTHRYSPHSCPISENNLNIKSAQGKPLYAPPLPKVPQPHSVSAVNLPYPESQNKVIYTRQEPILSTRSDGTSVRNTNNCAPPQAALNQRNIEISDNIRQMISSSICNREKTNLFRKNDTNPYCNPKISSPSENFSQDYSDNQNLKCGKSTKVAIPNASHSNGCSSSQGCQLCKSIIGSQNVSHYSCQTTVRKDSSSAFPYCVPIRPYSVTHFDHSYSSLPPSYAENVNLSSYTPPIKKKNCCPHHMHHSKVPESYLVADKTNACTRHTFKPPPQLETCDCRNEQIFCKEQLNIHTPKKKNNFIANSNIVERTPPASVSFSGMGSSFQSNTQKNEKSAPSAYKEVLRQDKSSHADGSNQCPKYACSVIDGPQTSQMKNINSHSNIAYSSAASCNSSAVQEPSSSSGKKSTEIQKKTSDSTAGINNQPAYHPPPAPPKPDLTTQVCQFVSELRALDGSTLHAIKHYKKNMNNDNVNLELKTVVPSEGLNRKSHSDRPPAWFLKFITNFRKQELWRLHQMFKIHDHLMRIESAKLNVLERVYEEIKANELLNPRNE